MAGVRSQALGWVGRKYLGRHLRRGLDLSSIGFLPQAALMPLHRTGMDPVPDLARLRHTTPIAKLPVGFGSRVAGVRPCRSEDGPRHGEGVQQRLHPFRRHRRCHRRRPSRWAGLR